MKKTRKNEIIDETQKREISLERAAELKSKIQDYLTKRNEIPEGLKMEEEIKKSRKKILKIPGVLNQTGKITDGSYLKEYQM